MNYQLAAMPADLVEVCLVGILAQAEVCLDLDLDREEYWKVEGDNLGIGIDL
jgi:hypothetical protein